MGLIDYNNDLPLQIVPDVIITVFDDLIIDILQHQKHLGIRNGGISVCQQGLEVKYREILFGRNGRRTIPDICVSSSGRELGNVIHKRTKQLTQILVVRTFKFGQNHIIQVIKNGIILRMQG